VDTGTVLDLEVAGAAHGGWCVAREPGGQVVFVRHALPGERVRAAVTEVTSRFARAEAVEVLSASGDRAEPPCPHARPGGCGGCDWQHASLAAQRRLKAEVVRGQLRRIAGIDRELAVEPLPGDRGGLGWRTRVRFSVAPDGTAGLRAHRSHRVVAVGDCPIAHPLVRAAEVTGRRWERAESVEVVVSPESGERVVTVTPGARPAAYLHRAAAGRGWRVSPATFWQVHPGAADALTAAVLEALGPRPGEVALDAYCGAGLFAGALAEAVGPTGTVIGIDRDRAAVRDARHNLRRYPWARVHAGDLASVLDRGGWPPPAVVVLDPPRAGATRPVIERLLRPASGHGPAAASGPRRVAYVSCDPATLARDLAVFARSGWRLAGLRAFDAFPMTHHVECVAVLAPG
jgi:tRNA/tmRNA/rRNA uracil-C5-methylase (TrmA/RlmC/RlmD family)